MLEGAEKDAIVSYQWPQLSGPSVQILAPTSASTSIVLPQVEQDEVAVFRIVVVDAGGSTSESTLDVVITDLGPQPVVNAGADQTVNEGDSVTLQATAAGEEGDVFSYTWTQLSGPAVSFNRHTARPMFVAPEVTGHQALEFEVLAQVQNGGNWNRDTVTITVNDLDPIDSAPPVVSHSVTSRKSKGKTYYDVSITSSEPGQTLFRYTAGLTIQVYAVASTAYPGWYVYPGSLSFQAGTGSKVVEYFAVDASGNTSAIQSTGEL